MRATPVTTHGLLLSCAALAACLAITPAAAASSAVGRGDQPHRDGCVTLREYNRVQPQMTRQAVHKIFDTNGVRTSMTQSGNRVDEVRSYDVCKSPDSTVTVSFEKRGTHPFLVVSKTAVFV
jgi:hypothetical protein